MAAESSLIERPIVPTGEYRASTRWSLLGPMRQVLLEAEAEFSEWGECWWERGVRGIADRLRGDPAFMHWAEAPEGLDCDADPDFEWTLLVLFKKATPSLTGRGAWGMRLRELPDLDVDDPELRRATQRATVEEFGVPPGADTTAWQLPDDRYAVHAAGLRAFLRAMYEATQARLAELGIERLMLWRGMAPPARTAPFGRVPLDLRPLSSWTTELDVAAWYACDRGQARAGRVLLADVPRERVIGTPLSGFGEMPSHEIVLLSGPGDAWALTWGSDGERPSACTERNIRRLAERYQGVRGVT